MQREHLLSQANKLTNLTVTDFQIKVTRLTTVFDLSILILSIIFALLTALDVITLSENGEKVFAMSLISCVMIFAGIISIPISLLYVACIFSLSNFEAITFGAIILWIGIPALISFIFYYKKLRRIH